MVDALRPSASPPDPTLPIAPVVTGGSAAWERLDAPAATPHGATRLVGATAAQASRHRSLRLRRSRSQVLSALDAGGSMLQRQGRDLLVGSSVLLLPVVALNLWVTSQVFDRTGSTTLTALGGDDVGTGIEDVAATLAVVFASLAAAVIGSFAAVVLLADRFGVPTSLRPALGRTVRRLPAVSVAWAGTHIWVPFFATWTLSSRSDDVAGRLFVVLAVGAIVASMTLFVVPVMMAEALGPFGALKRSWRLFRLRAGSAIGFVVSSTLIGTLLLAGIAFLPALAEAAGFITFGDYLWLAQGVSSQLGVIVVVPLVALATAELYLLVRLDAEGLDIALDAEAAFPPRRGGQP